MKNKLLKSILIPALGISSIAAVVPMVASCGKKSNVQSNVASTVVLNKENLELGVNDTFQLEATVNDGAKNKLSWSSSNEKAATVDANGLVTGKAQGDAVITVTAEGGAYSKCSVKVVKRPVQSVKFDQSSIKVAVGETVEVKLIFEPENATNKKVKLGFNESIMKVVEKENGVFEVTGLKAGDDRLSVETEDNETGAHETSCRVEVITK